MMHIRLCSRWLAVSGSEAVSTYGVLSSRLDSTTRMRLAVVESSVLRAQWSAPQEMCFHGAAPRSRSPACEALADAGRCALEPAPDNVDGMPAASELGRAHSFQISGITSGCVEKSLPARNTCVVGVKSARHLAMSCDGDVQNSTQHDVAASAVAFVLTSKPSQLNNLVCEFCRSAKVCSADQLCAASTIVGSGKALHKVTVCHRQRRGRC